MKSGHDSPDDGPDDLRAGWGRRSIAYLITALSLFAHLNPLFSWPVDCAETDDERPPTGLPGHPERLAGHVPLSAVEVLLWRDLGWVAAHPREA
jgi:hypothetical protein